MTAPNIPDGVRVCQGLRSGMPSPARLPRSDLHRVIRAGALPPAETSLTRAVSCFLQKQAQQHSPLSWSTGSAPHNCSNGRNLSPGMNHEDGRGGGRLMIIVSPTAVAVDFHATRRQRPGHGSIKIARVSTVPWSEVRSRPRERHEAQPSLPPFPPPSSNPFPSPLKIVDRSGLTDGTAGGRDRDVRTPLSATPLCNVPAARQSLHVDSLPSRPDDDPGKASRGLSSYPTQ